MTAHMTGDFNTPSPSSSVTIVRQPIFDESRRLWGYELVCGGERPSVRSQNCECETEGTAISVAASAFMGLQHIVKQGRKIMLDFDEMGILDDIPHALPPVLAAVQIDEQVFLRPAIPERIVRLQSDGYLIAVRGFSGDRQFEPLYQMADIIVVSLIREGKEEVSTLPAAIRGVGGRLLARHVDDAAQFETCREAGVALFQGAFFKQPDTITVRIMTSNEVPRLTLLRSVEQQVPDMEGLAQAIQSDAAIGFRLLTYLNSTVFRFPRKIRSIRHAIRLLEWPKLRTWLRVILLNDMSRAPESPELLHLAAQRGKFLELVARDHDFWGFDPESLHLLGLFSLLDTMLGTPMEEIVTFLPIENKIKSALRREGHNEYLPLVQLARCIEESRRDDAKTMIQRLNLNLEKVMEAFKAAVAWAEQLSPAGAEKYRQANQKRRES